jgi:hypothetical protein
MAIAPLFPEVPDTGAEATFQVSIQALLAHLLPPGNKVVWAQADRIDGLTQTLTIKGVDAGLGPKLVLMCSTSPGGQKETWFEPAPPPGPLTF